MRSGIIGLTSMSELGSSPLALPGKMATWRVSTALRDEFLNRELFGTLLEAKVLGEQYRQSYNTERPHSSLDYQTLAEFAASCAASSALTTAPS
jgi:transposase InsO family protein